MFGRIRKLERRITELELINANAKYIGKTARFIRNSQDISFIVGSVKIDNRGIILNSINKYPCFSEYGFPCHKYAHTVLVNENVTIS